MDQSSALSLSHLLYAATDQAKKWKRLYGKDIEIGYQALELLIAYEANLTGPSMISSGEHEFVTVSSFLN